MFLVFVFVVFVCRRCESVGGKTLEFPSLLMETEPIKKAAEGRSQMLVGVSVKRVEHVQDQVEIPWLSIFMELPFPV